MSKPFILYNINEKMRLIKKRKMTEEFLGFNLDHLLCFFFLFYINQFSRLSIIIWHEEYLILNQDIRKLIRQDIKT